MSNDPYSPCICGSGKKLKFCCQDILPDLQRVVKLMDNQPDAAEKLLRSLYAKHPDKEVLVTQLSALIMRQRRDSEARELLVDYLRRHPDEPRALLSLADVCLSIDGFFKSRRIVHRAFQLGARQFGGTVAMLATRIAGQMGHFGLAMAVREHLALAVRMATGEMRNELLMQLANFESQKSIPYPFRGRFALMDVSLQDPEAIKEDDRARRVSHIGCWEPASILYSRLCEKHPEQGALWHNLGLFQAWDGRLKEAAESLHRAAGLIEDFDVAAETEALAQLLDLETTDQHYSVLQHGVAVNSVSEVLTALDADKRFVRSPALEPDEGQQDGLAVVAEYEMLQPAQAGDSDDLPEVLADITVVDILDPDVARLDSPTVWVVSVDDDNAKAVQIVREVAGQNAKPEDPEDKPQVISRMPLVGKLFDLKNHPSDSISSSRHRELDQQRLASALETWLQTPHPALDNETPAQAAESQDKQVRVAGTLLVLDVVCNRLGCHPEVTELRQRLGIPAAAPLRPAAEQSVTALPLLKFSRLDPQALTDRQVVEFVHRITLVHHLRLMEVALEALTGRPDALTDFSPMRAHLLRASVARERNKLELASECFAAARAAVPEDGEAFRTRLELDIREFSTRLDDPMDPQLVELLQRIRDRYFVKIPEIEGLVREELQRAGRDDLLAELETASAGASSSAFRWSGSPAEPSQGSGSKLWLPGQD